MLPRPFELEGGDLGGEAVQDQDEGPRPAGPAGPAGPAALEDAVVLPQPAVRIGGESDVCLVGVVRRVERAEAVAVEMVAGGRCRRRRRWGGRR